MLAILAQTRKAIPRFASLVASLFLMCAVPAGSNPITPAETPITALAYRMAGDATRMRVIVEFDRVPDVRWMVLRGPHRLVVDLPESVFRFDPSDLEARGLVENVRYGRMNDGHARLILDMKGPFAVETLDVRQSAEEGTHRLLLDVVASSDKAFEALLAEQALTTGSTVADSKQDRIGAAIGARNERFTVVIDPGHGGIDGGAEGVSGTREKDLTLAFARELYDALKVDDRYNVAMTRKDDVFLRLDERVRIARQHNADLLISIHADTISVRGLRGASVYTISDKASDDVARAAADRENSADAVAGIEIPPENEQVADILVDLIMRETHGYSVRFARSLIGELQGTVELIRNPHRYAGFRILKAPDVPSVLVELGYLSNEQDEAQMSDPAWRGKAVAGIVNAISLFERARDEAGG